MVIYQKPAYFGELQITKFDTYARCHAYANVYYYRNSQRMIKKTCFGMPCQQSYDGMCQPTSWTGYPKNHSKEAKFKFSKNENIDYTYR